jgi:hypothetical protein
VAVLRFGKRGKPRDVQLREQIYAERCEQQTECEKNQVGVVVPVILGRQKKPSKMAEQDGPQRQGCAPGAEFDGGALWVITSKRP